MNNTPALPGVAWPGARSRYLYHPQQFKLVSLRECEIDNPICDQPELAADYWRAQVATDPHFNPDCETFVVLYLNTRRRIKGHSVIATGTLDTCLVHAREVFKVACIMAASAVILMHNHPSGDPSPSEADIKHTRNLIRGGEVLQIQVLDHVIVGDRGQSEPRGFRSLRELGYFAL